MNAQAILQNIDNARIGVIGDFCLDVYWYADMRMSELSRETPHYPLPIVREKESPGGAGNVACNLAALMPKSVCVAGIVGQDWRGMLLRQRLEEHGIHCAALISSPDCVTNTYIKPMRMGISDVIYEDPRLDFENHAPTPQSAEAQLLQALETMAGNVDVLCVCDQMRYGCVTETVRKRVCALGAAGLTVIVDSRNRIGLYQNAIVKPNDVEAAAIAGRNNLPLESIALKISEHTQRPAIITLGSNGCLVCQNGEVKHVAGRRVEPPLDTCGAGDTFLSALSSSFATGIDLAEAAELANAACAVTIRKIGTTGTASRAEILSELTRY